MIEVGEQIISEEILENHFICNLSRCKGNCCVFGDSGAPLEDSETQLLEAHRAEIARYMTQKGLRALEEQGSWVIDPDGDKVTPLVDNNKECAYSYFEDGIARCSIEKAYEEGAISFRKPISCHLYPIRLSRLKRGVALNYHRWGICEPARLLGYENNVPIFRFVREAIIRVFGDDFYDELETIYESLQTEKNK